MWAPGLLLAISTVLLGVCQLPLASVMFAVFCCWSTAAFCLLWPTFRQQSSPSKCCVWWAKNRMVVTITKMATGENKKCSSDWRAIRGWIGHSNYKSVNECESPTLGWSKNPNSIQLALHNPNFILPVTTNVSAKFYCDWSLFRGCSSLGCFILYIIFVETL